MKKLLCIISAAALFLLSGCSGGSIYTNYREVEQLMVIQTMGFDRSPDGITLSVSTGNSGGGTSTDTTTARMSAAAKTISLAQDTLRNYSASEELFFAHTSYIAIGEDAAKAGLSPYLDYISRSVSLREGTPIFIIVGSDAKKLVLGAGGKEYDATNVLKSLERNIKLRGDLQIFSAADISASINRRDSCLVTAIKCAKAKDVIKGAADDELTAIPEGYAVIKGGKMVGLLSLDTARGVSILQNKLKSCYTELSSDGQNVAVLMDKSDCEIDSERREINIKLSATLAEAMGEVQIENLNLALKKAAEGWVNAALDASEIYGCDFIGIEKPDYASYNINVSAEVGRSFDIENSEDSE